MIKIGRTARPEDRLWDVMLKGVYSAGTAQQPSVHSCGCVGPQPGETKCPCRLRVESEQGRSMIQEGVLIDGVAYDLIPKGKKS